MLLTTPRLTIAGLSGDGGKTLVTLGLARSLVARGLTVAAFKKGPDYIDAAWLGAATLGVGRNLDTYLMDEAALGSALAPAASAGLLLCEGNRGIFDGMDAVGTHSTASLARWLASPVVLVLDVTKMTRTAAALVLGCRAMDPGLDLAGVVLNRVATARQERVIRASLASVCDVPVVGAIPRLEGGSPLPGRHLGLVTVAEHPDREAAIARAAAAVAAHCDLDAMLAAARRSPARELPEVPDTAAGEPVRIAVVRDEASSFYYPENLEALAKGGAELVFVSAVGDEAVPAADAIVLGGGFPEEHAERLAGARRFAASLRAAAGAGVPVYAECGGLMLLARELVVDGLSYPMAGVLDLVVEQRPTPQGHGYVAGCVDAGNPFFPAGTRLLGHEFHYSRVVGGGDRARTALALERGQGLGGGRDAVVVGRVWAAYTHLHALGTPALTAGILRAARQRRAEARGGRCACGSA